MSDFLGCYNTFCRLESGDLTFPYDEFPMIYESYAGDDLFSMMIQNFFRTTRNTDIKQSLYDLLTSGKSLSTREIALLRKLSSIPVPRYENGEQVGITYIYGNREYFDEDIDLFHMNEVRPFDDEYGLLLFSNNWGVFELRDTETEEPVPESQNKLCLMTGGDTNTVLINLEEVENVTPDSLYDVLAEKSRYYAEKYPDTWRMEEMKKVGVFTTCDADRFFVASGRGPDFFDEIDSAVAIGYIYSEARQKVYVSSFFMNISQVNTFYPVREELFSYIKQFPFFCFVD